MKRIAALLVLVGTCTGMDCQGNMTDLAPEAPLEVLDPPLQDGAYGGPVVTRITLSFPGIGPTTRVGAGYRIVEIVGGRIETVRRAPDQNGAFGCESIEPGSQRIVPILLGGADGNQEDTIIDTATLDFGYIATLSLDDGASFTGEGSSLATPGNGGIDWTDTAGLSGSLVGRMVEVTITTTGFLQRIGDNGTVPDPDGMNGIWILRYTQGGQDGIEIRGLRVAVYADTNGLQGVADSDPVTAGTSAGDGVFFSFRAMSVFESDPTIRPYAITFRGGVGPEGQITGETTFTTDGRDPIVLATTLERVPSPGC